MSPEESAVRDHLQRFQEQLQPSREPNRTLLAIIGRPNDERDWQRLLAYFLRPAAGYGLGTDVLETFLQTVEAHTAITGLDGPLETVRIDVEVPTPEKRRVDLFLSQEERWFLCVELKVQADEHGEQTAAYVDADYVGTRDKSAFPEEGHNYLYLSPDEADAPTAPEFEHLIWGHLEDPWRDVLEAHRGDGGVYPTRGVAQFGEFLAMIRAETGESLAGMESYYRDVPTAKRAYEKLARTLATALEDGVRERPAGREALRTRRKRRPFPSFEHGSYNRIEIDKPRWQAGRNKPTVLFEFNFHLRPHLGPGETKPRPSVAVNLDIRGGSELKQRLRTAFSDCVPPEWYRSHGFGEPFTNTKWHFLTKEILLDETETPVVDVLEAFDVLYGFEDELDAITERV